jgi:hypothetical protein
MQAESLAALVRMAGELGVFQSGASSPWPKV